MSNNYDVYKNFSLKFNKEQNILSNLKIDLITLQSELIQNTNEISILNNNNNSLNHKINKIINNYMLKINIYLKLFSIIFIISTITLAGIISNLNFIFMLLFTSIIPFICIFINSKLTKLFKIKYYKKSKRISRINNLIQENQSKINEHKKNEEELLCKIDKLTITYNKQKDKVYLYETIIKDLNINNPAHIEEQINKNKSLKKTRKL
jgi:hypothetical protein